MLLRSMFAATVALVAALGAGADVRGQSTGAPVAAEEAPAPSRLRPGQITRPPIVVGPTIVEATTSFTCPNSNGSTTTYTVSVSGGNCTNNSTATAKPTAATCRNRQTGEQASASCDSGCGNGSGSCTQITTQ